MPRSARRERDTPGMGQPAITFLSDYGLEDEFVGVCHGVIAEICPQARVIDLTHGVPRHDIRQGAVILAQSLPYLPVGVHLAVVDPGVGADRRAVAITLSDGRILVGPDNGLLSLAVEAGGGAAEAVDIGRSPFCLQPVSATFHGRDIFAPVAAALAGGRELTEAGSVIAAGGLTGLELPQPRRERGELVVHVLGIDRFGNVELDAGTQLADSLFAFGRAVELVLERRRPPARGLRPYVCRRSRRRAVALRRRTAPAGAGRQPGQRRRAAGAVGRR